MVTGPTTTRYTGDFLLVVTFPDGRKERHTLEGREITVGRDPSNHIHIPHHLVSQFHAKFVRSGDSMTVVDLGSANKTRVNGHIILQKTLMGGEEIQFADLKCRLVAAAADEPALGSLPADEILWDTVESVEPRRRPDAHPREANRTVSKVYLSIGVIVLFAMVAGLALQVCEKIG